ncbi:MAG: DUF427 domain-containing protein [Alphaproteobacteria bacterium]|nr:DUF427 domain-containing protein [Alphaproteobacteria bacterium]
MTDMPQLPTENVWDYPRPPRLEPVALPLVVVFAGIEIARTTAGHRVLETSHPPTYYLPRMDIRMDLLTPAPGRSLCEFKGWAQYWTIEAGGRRSERAAWSYADPSAAYADIAEDLSFYASKVDLCSVGGVRVDAQEGDFYGGWITGNLTGPFKGGPGTAGW